MKYLIILSLTLLLGACAHQPATNTEQARVLIIASNVTEMADGLDARNNLWEVAPAFHIFRMHDLAVDIASPSGGAVEYLLDPIGISRYAYEFEGFGELSSQTLPAAAINAGDYQAVYFGGGYGLMFDVASDPRLLNTVAQVYENGGVIGGNGHGAAGFANVRLSDGDYLVRGKRVAGYPDSTEREKSWADHGRALPFLLESRLRANGAIAENKQTLTDKHAVVIDQRVVSSMFLPSAAVVAEWMVRCLRGHGPEGSGCTMRTQSGRLTHGP